MNDRIQNKIDKAEKEIHDLFKQWPPPEPVGTVRHETLRILGALTLAAHREGFNEGIEKAAKEADNYDLSGQESSTTSPAGKAANKTARNIVSDIRALKLPDGPEDQLKSESFCAEASRVVQSWPESRQTTLDLDSSEPEPTTNKGEQK